MKNKYIRVANLLCLLLATVGLMIIIFKFVGGWNPIYSNLPSLIKSFDNWNISIEWKLDVIANGVLLIFVPFLGSIIIVVFVISLFGGNHNQIEITYDYLKHKRQFLLTSSVIALTCSIVFFSIWIVIIKAINNWPMFILSYNDLFATFENWSNNVDLNLDIVANAYLLLGLPFTMILIIICLGNNIIKKAQNEHKEKQRIKKDNKDNQSTIFEEKTSKPLKQKIYKVKKTKSIKKRAKENQISKSNDYELKNDQPINNSNIVSNTIKTDPSLVNGKDDIDTNLVDDLALFGIQAEPQTIIEQTLTNQDEEFALPIIKDVDAFEQENYDESTHAKSFSTVEIKIPNEPKMKVIRNVKKRVQNSKTNLIEMVIKETKNLELPKKTYNKVIDEIFNQLIKALLENDNITINGFGKFKVYETNGKEVIDPVSGEKAWIEPHLSTKMINSKIFKKKINDFLDLNTPIIKKEMYILKSQFNDKTDEIISIQ